VTRDQVPHPYKTTVASSFVHFINFYVFGRIHGDKRIIHNYTNQIHVPLGITKHADSEPPLHIIVSYGDILMRTCLPCVLYVQSI